MYSLFISSNNHFKMRRILLLVFLGYFAQLSSSQKPQPQVTIKNGLLQGVAFKLTPNMTIDEFRGIPYASPPVGALRFQRPQPASSWTGTKNVSTDRALCIQSATPGAAESEDCLYLDVYRPNVVSTPPLPVLVFIHGGGNSHGNKNAFNSTLVASGGLVIVTINYRLGPLGFLSNDDAAMPGNYAMLDQVLALQWVQDNIAVFGGDPKAVTIMGESAGSIDVSLHIVSPLSKGLFSRAIMMSGSAIKSRNFPPPLPQGTPTPTTLAAAAGFFLGCNQTGTALLACMQSKDVKDLYHACLKAKYRDTIAHRTFVPRVENVFGFLPDYPLRLISRGAFNKVDVMSGFNAQEMGSLKPVGDKDNDGLTIEEFRTLARKELVDFFPYLDSDTYMNILEGLYLHNVTNPLDIRTAAIEMKTDISFKASMFLEAQLSKQHNHGSKYFVYEFNYMPSYNTKPEWQGVLHAFNVQFVFGFPWKFESNHHSRYNATDKKVSDMMMTLWTNFVKVGDPTPTGTYSSPLIRWQQLYPKQLKYLLIDEQLTHCVFNTTHQTQVLDFYRQTQAEYLAAMETDLQVIG